MKMILMILDCITNLHVGSGEANYAVVDNEVERDPVTEFPTIHSSGVKGALRAYLKRNGMSDDELKAAFGASEAGKTTQGSLNFLAADMIAMPARASKGDQTYYLLTTNTMLDRYKELCAIADIDPCLEEECSDADNSAEEIQLTDKVKLKDKNKNITRTLWKVSSEEFKSIALPIFARNYLENGISRNLWYEEAVPYRSIFCAPVIGPEEQLKKFVDAVNGKLVQFGANATIGYGLCKVIIKEGGMEGEK